MAYLFYLRHLARDGTPKKLVVDDFRELTYRRVINEVGRLDFLIAKESSVIQTLNKYDLFEVYWKNDYLGVPWHRDFEAIVRKVEPLPMPVAANRIRNSTKNGTKYSSGLAEA